LPIGVLTASMIYTFRIFFTFGLRDKELEREKISHRAKEERRTTLLYLSGLSSVLTLPHGRLWFHIGYKFQHVTS
jgi:hypothetical protein